MAHLLLARLMLTDILSCETGSDLKVWVLEKIEGGRVRQRASGRFVSALWAESV
jgi:hypothetical protein